ncbi:hypothetical protein F751_0905 [Auxenochlorella protothecoides]|uniref:Exostosin GT47 domain-containing protein n=1 Tax=Auxenochlorella protothecoides TaxID=3075 RepID=A0A087SI13_AUXPR|nr:hypothetical protein F751_0905 [Auxenochlorella protothecoides]KFM25367.1 hypothetical protein F751_0905 [Auxenochlorella protothecoides]
MAPATKLIRTVLVCVAASAFLLWVGRALLCNEDLALPRVAPSPQAQITGTPDSDASCSIYVLDPVQDLGLPRCNFADPAVWPFAAPNNKLQASGPLQHWEQQHAVNYWVAQAIAMSGYQTNDRHGADMIFLNTHCFEAWRLGWLWNTLPERKTRSIIPIPDLQLQPVLQHLHTWPQWRADNGAHIVVTPFYPGTPNSTVNLLRPCNSSVYSLVSTHKSFCKKGLQHHNDQGLILPFVTSIPNEGPEVLKTKRDIFVFYRGGCSHPSLAEKFVWGKIQRRAVVQALTALNKPDLDLSCACDICPGALDHDETLRRMLRSTFCPVLAGDAQTSRRQVEVILSGCVPVYVGPGWHTLPLADAIDHAAFSVFVHVKGTVPWIVTDPAKRTALNGPTLEREWYMDAELGPGQVLEVESVAGIEAALRALPPEVLAAKQAALREAYGQFSYRPAPGEIQSGAGRIIVENICRRARAAMSR